MSKSIEELNALFSLGHYILIARYLGVTPGGSSKHLVSLIKITEKRELIPHNVLLKGYCKQNKRGDFICYDIDTLIYYLPNLKQAIYI